VEKLERDHLENMGVDGEKNINIDLQELVMEQEMDSFAQDGERWRASVNLVMNLGVP